MTRPNERVISASQVGAYTYCAHAWWLGAVEGLPPDAPQRLSAGRAVHERHGRRAWLAEGLTRLAYVLLALAGLTGGLWLLSQLGG